jgi:hypothetical protein
MVTAVSLRIAIAGLTAAPVAVFKVTVDVPVARVAFTTVNLRPLTFVVESAGNRTVRDADSAMTIVGGASTGITPYVLVANVAISITSAYRLRRHLLLKKMVSDTCVRVLI